MAVIDHDPVHRPLDCILGYVLALLLPLSRRHIKGILLVFPLWVLLTSVYILIDNLRWPSPAAATTLEQKP